MPPRVKLPSSTDIRVTDSPLAPSGTVTSIDWNAADQVPSTMVSTYRRPPSPSTGLSAPPVKVSPSSVKPPSSAAIRVTVPPCSPSATSTVRVWKVGGGGFCWLATGPSSAPAHTAELIASRANSARENLDTTLEVVIGAFEERTNTPLSTNYLPLVATGWKRQGSGDPQCFPSQAYEGLASPTSAILGELHSRLSTRASLKSEFNCKLPVNFGHCLHGPVPMIAQKPARALQA